jgi:hypothetical protein
MKRCSLFVAFIVVLLVSSALAQDVRYNFDKGANFSQFKSYKWVAIKDAAAVNGLVDKQIKEAFDAQLAQKGLTRVDSETADLFIGYQTAIGQEKEFTSFNSGWGYGPGWYGGGWYGYPGGGITTGQTSTIYSGQLALDMYDATNHTLVWRAVANKTLDTKAKPEKRQKNLNKAVAKMLKSYPPQAKQ